MTENNGRGFSDFPMLNWRVTPRRCGDIHRFAHWSIHGNCSKLFKFPLENLWYQKKWEGKSPLHGTPSKENSENTFELSVLAAGYVAWIVASLCYLCLVSWWRDVAWQKRAVGADHAHDGGVPVGAWWSLLTDQWWAHSDCFLCFFRWKFYRWIQKVYGVSVGSIPSSRYQYLQIVSNCGNKWKGMLQDSANVATSATNYKSNQSPLAAANTKTWLRRGWSWKNVWRFKKPLTFKHIVIFKG